MVSRITTEEVVKRSKYLSIIESQLPIFTRILLDSGAIDVNLMSMKYIGRLEAENIRLKKLPILVNHVSPLGGGSIKVEGKVETSIILPDGTTSPILEFFITDTPMEQDFILGTLAHEMMDIRTKLKSGITKIGDKSFPLIKNNVKRFIAIRLKENVKLKAGKTIQVAVVVEESNLFEDKDQYYPVIPSQALLDTKGILMKEGMCREKLEYIQLSNIFTRSINLKKDALVGHIVRHTSNVCALAVEEFLDDKWTEDEVLGDNMYYPEKTHGDEVLDIMNSMVNNNTNLTERDRSKLVEVLKKYLEIFHTDAEGVVKTVQTRTVCTVDYIVEDVTPIRSVPYRYSPKVKEFISNTIKDLLEAGVIDKSKSPWAFPVVVAVKGEKYRFCVDYSKLSEKTKLDSYPLPRIDDTLDYLSKAKYYTVVDAANGFWQVPIKESHKERLAFCTPFGTYQWNVMPFGYANAPAIYQRAMNETLDGALFRNCLVYVDDIIVYSDSYEQHLKDIDEVFNKLKKFGWKLKITKSSFAVTTINYLGHTISQGKVTVLKKNIDKLRQMKRPRNIKETQAFLGCINYYRRFIQGVNYITEPLLVNLRNKDQFIWGEEQEEAFMKIVDLLCSEPILRLPDYTKEFILKTDASGVGYGGVLCQVHDGVEHPISFFSGSFNPSQRSKWNHWHREAYAVIQGIKRYDHYLREGKFRIVTDNESILTLIKPQKELTHHMIDRWRLFLQSYKYYIVHRPGKFLVLEDSLSRSINFNHLVLKDLVEEQRNDKFLSGLLKLIKNPQIVDSDKQLEEQIIFYQFNKDNIVSEDDTLYYLNTGRRGLANTRRIMVPENMIDAIITEHHVLPASGHLGYEKTYYKLKKIVWFPNMYTRIRKKIESCDVCDRNRRFPKFNDVLHPIVATKPWEIIELDHVGPFPRTINGNEYVLSIVDHFTRKRFYIPVRDTEAKTSAQALIDNVFTNFEFPKTILSDRGSGFTSVLTEEVGKVSNIELSFALTEQHRTVGSVEVSNKIMEDALRKYVNNLNQDDWDKFVRLIAYAYNKSVAPHGYTPDYLISGIEQRSDFKIEEEILSLEEYKTTMVKDLIKARKLANETLEEYRQKMMKVCQPKRLTTFDVGEWVHLKRPQESVVSGLSKKLMSKSLGPFKVLAIDKDKGNITLDYAPGNSLEVKVNQVRKAKSLPKNSDRTIVPSKTTEIVVLDDLDEIEKLKTEVPKRDEWMSKSEKAKIDVKKLVGTRIEVNWTYGKNKGIWAGTIIGYSANLVNALIYYDDRTIGVDPRVDYYNLNVSNKNTYWRRLISR